MTTKMNPKKWVARINQCASKDALEAIEDEMVDFIDVINWVKTDEQVFNAQAEVFARHQESKVNLDDLGIEVGERYIARNERISELIENAYDARWEQVEWLPEEE